LPVKGVVITAVLKFFLDAPTHLKLEARCHGDIPCVEEGMDIAPQEKPIARIVAAAIRVWLDVRGLERRQGPLARDGATPFIGICHDDPERGLPKPRPDEGRGAIACLIGILSGQ